MMSNPEPSFAFKAHFVFVLTHHGQSNSDIAAQSPLALQRPRVALLPETPMLLFTMSSMYYHYFLLQPEAATAPPTPLSLLHAR